MMTIQQTTPVVDRSASVAMFNLLQKRFGKMRFGLAGWAVEPNDPLDRLYLNLLWGDGSVCNKSGDFYYDVSNSAIPLVFTERNEETAKNAWEIVDKHYFCGAYFTLSPIFKVPERRIEKLEDLKDSYLRVSCIGESISGLCLPDIKAVGWEDYFPSASESNPAKWSRNLIRELTKLEDVKAHLAVRNGYTTEEVKLIEERVDEYKNLLRVMG